MARDYAKVSARFWTGDTGRQLRALGAEAQVVALYLVTCPSSNMVGLYYLPVPVLVHETGLTFEGASKALRSLGEVGFAHYDDAQEVVWVPEMARHQVGDSLDPKDKRVKGVATQAAEYKKCRFYADFVAKYRDAFRLTGCPENTPKAGKKASRSEGASKGYRSQEQEQEQEQKTAAATRASARSEEPAAAEATTQHSIESKPGTAEPAGAPEAAPDLPPTPAAVGHSAEAATLPKPPKPVRLAAPLVVDDDVRRPPPRVLDLTDLDELGAELRVRLQERLAPETWKPPVSAPERRFSAKAELERLVGALGLARAEDLAWRAIQRRLRQGLKPPAVMAWFCPLFEEELTGGNPMPAEVPGVEVNQVLAARDAEVEARWAPLMARLTPSQREELAAEKARLETEIRSQGLWTSQETLLFHETEAWLHEKWSRKAASGEA